MNKSIQEQLRSLIKNTGEALPEGYDFGDEEEVKEVKSKKEKSKNDIKSEIRGYFRPSSKVNTTPKEVDPPVVQVKKEFKAK